MQTQHENADEAAGDTTNDQSSDTTNSSDSVKEYQKRSDTSQTTDAKGDESDSPNGPQKQRGFFGHPLGLLNILATEMCERFSYYGMRAILVFFLYDAIADGGLGISSTDAMVIMSIFGSLVYLTGVVGGWLADRVLGSYKAVLYGGIIIAVGHIILGFPLGLTGTITALSLIAIGTGFLKPNVSVMVGQLYAKGDTRRQAGFSLLVMAINIGSFVSPLVVGTVSAAAGYHIAFLIPAVAMVAGLFVYLALSKHTLEGIGRIPADPLTSEEKKRWLIIVGAALAFGVLLFGGLALADLLKLRFFVDSVLILCLLISAGLFIFMIRDKRLSKVEQRRVTVYIPIIIVTACFWGISEQQASTLAVVAKDLVDNDIFGFIIPAAWYSSVNPLVIIALSPLFAFLWTKLGAKQPNTVVKMTTGLLLAGLSFVLIGLVFLFNTGQGLISPLWLLCSLGIMTVGELFLSPTGLNATTLLAPRIHASKMMALWFIANALGQGINAVAVRFFDMNSPADFFFVYAGAALILSTGFFLLRKPILTALE